MTPKEASPWRIKMKANKIVFHDFEIEIDESLPDDTCELWYIGRPKNRLLARVTGIGLPHHSERLFFTHAREVWKTLFSSKKKTLLK